MKIRQSLPETIQYRKAEQLSKIQGLIKSEVPNNSLYTFDATLELFDKSIPLTPTQLLLRGAQLRNTDHVYGIVVFTGHESKLIKNAT